MTVTDKTAARKRVFELRSIQEPEQLKVWSKAIFDRLVKQAIYTDAAEIYAYMDFRNEVMTTEFILRAWADGKRVAVPKVRGKEMDFFEIENFETLKDGYFGIREPDSTSAPVEWPNALMIVPGVAFDRKGHRLGYGQGFYDRFLEKRPGVYKAAVAFEFQLFDELPHEATDIPMQQVITENAVYLN